MVFEMIFNTYIDGAVYKASALVSHTEKPPCRLLLLYIRPCVELQKRKSIFDTLLHYSELLLHSTDTGVFFSCLLVCFLRKKFLGIDCLLFSRAFFLVQYI